VRFEKTELSGVLVVVPEPSADARGFFARTFDRAEFVARNLPEAFPQESVAYNECAGTIRGLHYQIGAHAEEKLVRCTAGRLWDVVLDLRQDSATFGRAFAIELTAENHLALYIPSGCAHGYQTLAPSTEALYLISRPYASEAARGIAFDDPAVGISWPLPVAAISERDRNFPLLAAAELP
jgi:dTDP-4-dehydrorhamnose 3,5-epimerase